VPGGTRREVQSALPAAEHGPTLSWWATILGLVAVGMLLAGLLFTYGYLSLREGGWPPAGVPRPDVALPTVAALTLLASGIPAYLGQRAATAGRPLAIQGAAAATALLGVGHLVLQAMTYRDLPMAPAEHAYGSVFILLPVMHHLLLAAGIVGYLVVMAQVWGAPGERLRGTVRALSVWWFGHVGFWALIYGTLYLSPLVLGGGGG
jgi:cytochrome c oxidase subunit 3